MQKALLVVVDGDKIVVAKGTCFPDEGPGIVNNDKDTSFVLKSGVDLFGG